MPAYLLFLNLNFKSVFILFYCRFHATQPVEVRSEKNASQPSSVKAEIPISGWELGQPLIYWCLLPNKRHLYQKRRPFRGLRVLRISGWWHEFVVYNNVYSLFYMLFWHYFIFFYSVRPCPLLLGVRSEEHWERTVFDVDCRRPERSSFSFKRSRQSHARPTVRQRDRERGWEVDCHREARSKGWHRPFISRSLSGENHKRYLRVCILMLF